MKCKNCGANVPNNSSICTNCGFPANKNSDYVLLTKESDIQVGTFDLKKQRKKRAISFAISILLTIAILASGACVYFISYNKAINKPQPELAFTSGYGVINEKEPVVYTSIKDSAKIEFIHDVNIYDSAVDKSNKNSANLVSSNYQYTKNIDDSFRTIFFDMNELNIKDTSNKTYTFEIKLTFYEDENLYTYYQQVNLTGQATKSIQEIVFDHTEKSRYQDTANENSSLDFESTDYIYSYYWFSAPSTKEDKHSISAIRFYSDGTYSLTDYNKTTSSVWNVTNSKGTFQMIKNELTLKDEDGYNIKQIILEPQTKSVYENDGTTGEKTSQFTSRSFNSIEEAEGFFGL